MQGIIGLDPSEADYIVQEPSIAMRYHAAMQARALRNSVGPSMPQAYPVPVSFPLSDPRLIGLAQGGMNAMFVAPMGMNGILPACAFPPMQSSLRSFPHGPHSGSRLLMGRQQHISGLRPRMIPKFFPGITQSEHDVEMYLRGMEHARLAMKAERLSPTMKMKFMQNDCSVDPRNTTSDVVDLHVHHSQIKEEVVTKPQKKMAEKTKKARTDLKDKPKRPLSAYNCFFKEERSRILGSIPDYQTSEEASSAGKGKRRRAQHGKISFEDLGKAIGQRWQSLSPEESRVYKMKAAEDMKRYRNEMAEYLAKQEKEDDASATAAVSPDTAASHEDTLVEVTDQEGTRGEEIETVVTEEGDEQTAKKMRTHE